MIELQKALSSVGWSTHSSESCCGATVLIALVRLMLYQSARAVSPGMKRGCRITPAVHVFAVSAVRLGLPPMEPEMLTDRVSMDAAGSVTPSEPSNAAQFAAR